MLGAIVGDIVGSVYEFDNHRSKDFPLFREEQISLAGHDRITTEIELASPFYYAEEKHQQYLAKYQGG